MYMRKRKLLIMRTDGNYFRRKYQYVVVMTVGLSYR